MPLIWAELLINNHPRETKIVKPKRKKNPFLRYVLLHRSTYLCSLYWKFSDFIVDVEFVESVIIPEKVLDTHPMFRVI